ncbi:MAG: hypothetical protein J0I49_04370 [Pseudonocardia sp.]|uniref:hypothetical protein n=1 Tax=Pseudonocardia sp. TaxID=60912 RepID=UPI001AC34299|nr:hypothetical protein [Pseudonocardia sp.]MBN9097337.1 hypothetical protein [Pseudonocardia sp.]
MTTEQRHPARRRRVTVAATAAIAAAMIVGLSGCQIPLVGVADASTPTTAQRAAGATTTATAGKEHGKHKGPGTRPTGAPTPPADPADPDPNCSLEVPPAPLTAAGLATPYLLSATDRRAGACHEANTNQSAFVEATILDPATGALSVYRPLVIDAGTTPAVAPVPPKLPANAVVGVWFGYQGDTLTLRNAGSCVNGTPRSPFGQFGYCNAPAFFAAANAAVRAKKITVPPLGTGVDGLPCPTTRDFGVVDQDQSDNLTTAYVALPDGRTAQSTPAAKALPGATTLTNASDNGLLANRLDPAIGCHPFTAPDLTSGGTPSPALALNELQAAAFQGAPVATVPPNDPMALVGDRPSVAKTDLYRVGVDMGPMNPQVDTGAAYCTNLAAVAPKRLALDRPFTAVASSPDPGTSSSLFGFLTNRLTESWTNLGCEALVHRGAPVVDGAPATADPAAPTTTAAPAPPPTTPPTTPTTTPTTTPERTRTPAPTPAGTGTGQTGP